MKRRPLFWLAIAFVLGIVLTDVWRIQPSFGFGAGLLAAVAVAALKANSRLTDLRFAFLFLFVGAIGSLRWSVDLLLPANHIVHFITEDERILIRVRGVVSSRPETTRRSMSPSVSLSGDEEERSRFLLSKLQVEDAAPSEYQAFEGTLQVIVDGEIPGLAYGDEVKCLGWLSRPTGPSNPGESDYRRQMARQGVHAIFRMQHAANIQGVSHNKGFFLQSFFFKLNDSCRSLLYEHTPPESVALLDGLLLGNRGNIRPEVNQDFIATGTRHILAISGLHVGLVTAGALSLFRLLRAPLKLSNLLAIGVAFFYAFLTGINPPSLRAAVMVSVFLLGTVLGRVSDALNQLGLSALIILVLEPEELFGAGFQLSFIAVLGILLLTDEISVLSRRQTLAEQLMTPMQRYTLRRQFLRYTRFSLCVAGAAWLATLPLTAAYFHVISPLAILTNIIVCPLAFVILCVGLVSLPVAWAVPSLGAVGLGLAGGLTWLLQETVHLFALPPGAGIYVSGPSRLGLWLYYLGLGLFALRRHFQLSLRLVGATCLALFLFSFGYSRVHDGRNSGKLEMTVLDVGHGCAALLELPDGSTLLYDIGTYGTADITAHTVAPFLWHKGIRRLDRVVLTHLDSDHYSGFLPLLQRFQVGELSVPLAFDAHPIGRYLVKEAKRKGAAVRVVSEGMVLHQGKGFELRCLNPPQDASARRFLTDNDASIVLRVRFEQIRLLLCADIEETAIRDILAGPEDLRAEAILVPHHGAMAENSSGLAERVRPRFAIMSGWSERVHPETKSAYERAGSEVHVTEADGAIMLSTDGKTLELRSFRGGKSP